MADDNDNNESSGDEKGEQGRFVKPTFVAAKTDREWILRNRVVLEWTFAELPKKNVIAGIIGGGAPQGVKVWFMKNSAIGKDTIAAQAIAALCPGGRATGVQLLRSVRYAGNVGQYIQQFIEAASFAGEDVDDDTKVNMFFEGFGDQQPEMVTNLMITTMNARESWEEFERVLKSAEVMFISKAPPLILPRSSAAALNSSAQEVSVNAMAYQGGHYSNYRGGGSVYHVPRGHFRGGRGFRGYQRGRGGRGGGQQQYNSYIPRGGGAQVVRKCFFCGDATHLIANCPHHTEHRNNLILLQQQEAVASVNQASTAPSATQQNNAAPAQPNQQNF